MLKIFQGELYGNTKSTFLNLARNFLLVFYHVKEYSPGTLSLKNSLKSKIVVGKYGLLGKKKNIH